MPSEAAVVPDPSKRLAALDILRGFALFGMIFIHFHQEFRLTTEGVARYPGETWVGYIAWMAIEQKAWGTFAFLFGVGFAVLMRRAEQRGQPVVFFYVRRLAALALIAFALDVLTGFTILLDYAIWGVPLLLIRKWPTALLLVIALLSAGSWAIQPFGTAVYEWATLGRDGANQAAASRPRPQMRTPAAQPQSYGEFAIQRLQLLKQRYAHRSAWYPPTSFALFIIGLLAVRRGVFDDPRRHTRVIAVFMGIGLTSWVVFWFGLPHLPTAFAPQAAGRLMTTGLGIVNEQWLAFTYIGALTLLLAYRPEWTARLSLFGIAGRMALTNYVTQCIVIFILSSRFALDLHLRPYLYTLGAVGLFAVAVAFSHVWLSRFRYGPLEWVWRAVTYLRVPPLLKN